MLIVTVCFKVIVFLNHKAISITKGAEEDKIVLSIECLTLKGSKIKHCEFLTKENQIKQ